MVWNYVDFRSELLFYALIDLALHFSFDRPMLITTEPSADQSLMFFMNWSSTDRFVFLPINLGRTSFKKNNSLSPNVEGRGHIGEL